ncbi:hypothetical protein MJH12_12075 [bacterium]|nr:hypothetical protein [bacterium]
MENGTTDISRSNAEYFEKLYQTNPTLFSQQFKEIAKDDPNSQFVRIWNARLGYDQDNVNHFDYQKLIYVICASFLATFLTKLPEIISIDKLWFYSRFPPIIIAALLSGYFLLFRKKQNHITIFVFLSFFVCGCIMYIFPDDTDSASLLMSILHLPSMLLSLLGVAYVGHNLGDSEIRLKYLKYLGEIIILSALILLGGVVLTLLTLGLFQLIEVDIGEFYFKNVIPLGIISSPFVATLLYDQVISAKSKLATVIADVFSPLFLLMVVFYLLAMFFSKANPFLNREFLIIFNGLLLVVWGISVFSISGRILTSNSRVKDCINIALMFVTLVVNAVALAAITYRWYEFGTSINRIAVTGVNVLTFVHLIQISKAYINYLHSVTGIESVKLAITKFLPMYSIWSIFIVFLLPVLSGFR